MTKPPANTSNEDEIPRLINDLRQMRIAIVHGGPAIKGDTVINLTGNPRGTKTYQEVALDIGGELVNCGFNSVRLYGESRNLAAQLHRDQIDVAWLNTGGGQGSGAISHAAAIMEMSGIPYVGHSPRGYLTLDNKDVFKALLAAHDIPTARWISLPATAGQGGDSDRKQLVDQLRERFKAQATDGKFVVKPQSGRASIGVMVAATLGDVPATIALVNAKCPGAAIIVEDYLPGPEYVVGVDGNWSCRHGQFRRGSQPFAFSAAERILRDGEEIFESMDTRKIDLSRVRPVEGKQRTALLALARRVHRDCGIETLIRLDVRTDANGTLRVLEANPKPDLAKPRADKLSLISHGLSAERMDYGDLILSILANRLDYLRAHQPAMYATLTRVNSVAA